MRYAFSTKNKQKIQGTAFFIQVGAFISPWEWLPHRQGVGPPIPSLRAVGPTSRKPAAIKQNSALLEFPDRWQYVKLTNALEGYSF